jgi:hypothetical protein
VPEFTNKTPQTVDTRALRTRLINDLAEAKFDAVPMAAGSPADLQRHAAEQGYDYVLLAEVSELKVAKAGGIGGLMKAATGAVGGFVGVPGQGPSYDESLGEAVQNAAKAVQKALQK